VTQLEPKTREEAEAWFLAHGLPYSVDDVRGQVRRRLAASRLLIVAVVGLLIAVPAGVAVGWGGGQERRPERGVGRRLRHDDGAAPASLELLFPLATRAMPMLLLFVTFLFINTEVWMIASALDGGVLWGAVLMFAGATCASLPTV